MISKKIKSTASPLPLSKEYLDELAAGVLSRDRRALAKAITLAESRLPEQVEATRKLMTKLGASKMHSKSIAITGPPGAGKSTFIESIGKIALSQGYKIAVISIDPSSELTGGSILGDKTRMPFLSSHPDVFVRPSPSGGDLGGVHRKSWEVKLLCEAAGYDLIFVETVGVGQSESEVSNLVDMTVVLMQPGSGDDLQGIKKGLNELGDLFIVNKADGDQFALAREAKSYMLVSRKLSNIERKTSQVVLHSSHDEHLSKKCWESILSRHEELNKDKSIEHRRQTQETYWFEKRCALAATDLLTDLPVYKEELNLLVSKVAKGELTSYHAIQLFVDDLSKFFNKK